MYASLGMLLCGGGALFFKGSVIVRRTLLGLFAVACAVFIAFTVLSVNRMAGKAGDENRMGEAVNDIYRQKDNRKPGQR